MYGIIFYTTFSWEAASGDENRLNQRVGFFGLAAPRVLSVNVWGNTLQKCVGSWVGPPSNHEGILGRAIARGWSSGHRPIKAPLNSLLDSWVLSDMHHLTLSRS